MRVVQMDEGEKLDSRTGLDPLACGAENRVGGALNLGRVLARVRAEVKRAVIDVESAVQTEPCIQHIAADEGGRAKAVRLQHRAAGWYAGPDLLAIFLDAVYERVSGT